MGIEPSQYDYFAPEFREENEAEVLAELRGKCPVLYSEREKQYELLTYDAVRDAFIDTETFSNNWAPPPERRDPDVAVSSSDQMTIPNNVDPPEQIAYRKLITPMFRPQQIETYADAVRDHAINLIEPLEGRERIEFVHDFATPFPVKVFCRLAGFPEEDYEKLLWWREVYLNFANPVTADRLNIPPEDREPNGRIKQAVASKLTDQTAKELVAYFSDLYDEVLESPGEGWVSELAHADLDTDDGGTRKLTKEEVIRYGFNLFLGGMDTVASTLSYAVDSFATDPELRREFIAIMDDDSAIEKAITELVRVHSIVRMPRRVEKEHAVFRGVDLKRDDIVNCDLLAANRDPAKFEDPDAIKLDRHPNPHLGFGHGRHRCIGIHLARQELKIALREWHRRIPDYRRDPDDPSRRGPSVVRAISRLPLILGA